MLLASTISALLSRQYYHEIGNHIFYSILASWADNRGLDGAVAFCKKQAAGELEHALSIAKYITDRNDELAPGAVPSAEKPTDFENLFTAVQARELMTTDFIMELLSVATRDGDAATAAWLNAPGGLVLEQVEEENLIQTILDRIAVRRQGDESGAWIHDIDEWLKGLA